MRAHSTNLLQLLDATCFLSLKRAYGHLVENKARLGFNHITKFDFLKAYPKARMEAFKPDTIPNGFEATGLIPFNPGRLLEQLNIRLKTPTLPGSQSTNSEPKTPHNLKQLEKQAFTIKRVYLEEICKVLNPLLEMWLDKIIKGHKMALNEAILARQEVRDFRAMNKKEGRERKRCNRQIHFVESPYVQEAQQPI